MEMDPTIAFAARRRSWGTRVEGDISRIALVRGCVYSQPNTFFYARAMNRFALPLPLRLESLLVGSRMAVRPSHHDVFG